MRVLAAFLLVGSAVGLEICGNYCGPDWCDGQVIEECADVSGSGCKPSSANCQEQGPTDGSCADACCKGACGLQPTRRTRHLRPLPHPSRAPFPL